MTFKVYVDVGEPSVHSNALSFGSVEAAAEYADDLYRRWLLVRRWFVVGPDGDEAAHLPVEFAEEHTVARGGAQ